MEKIFINTTSTRVNWEMTTFGVQMSTNPANSNIHRGNYFYVIEGRRNGRLVMIMRIMISMQIN